MLVASHPHGQFYTAKLFLLLQFSLNPDHLRTNDIDCHSAGNKNKCKESTGSANFGEKNPTKQNNSVDAIFAPQLQPSS